MAVNVPVFVPSFRRSGKPILQYKSRRWEGSVLEFSYKDKNRKDPSVEYYRCVACFAVSSRKRLEGESCPVAHVTLKNGVLQTDPDNPSTSHSCDPLAAKASAVEVLASRYMCETRTNIRETRKRPRQAFNEAVAGVAERFDDYDDDVQDGIKQKLTSGYGFHSKRRALSYNRHIRAFKNVTLDNIPNELRETVDNKAFLRHENTTPGEEMLIFFADNDLECLAAAETIMCDGNFVFTPPEFCNPGQLYTVHAIVRGESHPIAYALMKRRDTAAYEEFFTALKVGVLAALGHLGTLQNSATWLFDFEVAAIKAAVNTFSADALLQPITVYGCVFHFAKAINEKRDALGLRSVCRSNPDVSLWFTRVRHLPFLPEAFRLEFARDLTTSLPQGLSPLVTAELSAFGTYFQNFWIDSSSVQNLWGHFGNTGPRTTNHVEGWHNGLRAQLPNHHPQLAEVTQFFRMQQHCSQVRMSSLLHDQLAVPRQQDPAVSRKNVKLAAEMEQFRAHATYNLVSFDVVCQYLDNISGIGVS